MNTFTLTLSLEQINSIIKCMEQAPFVTVAGHIDTFQKQMQAQANAAKAENAPAAHPEGG